MEVCARRCVCDGRVRAGMKPVAGTSAVRFVSRGSLEDWAFGGAMVDYNASALLIVPV